MSEAWLSLKEAAHRGGFPILSSRRQFNFPDGRRLTREVLLPTMMVLVSAIPIRTHDAEGAGT